MSTNDSGAASLLVPRPRLPRKGLFLSFEGGDGVGKSTQIARLRHHLVHEREVAEEMVLDTREPGGTRLGASVRELLLHGDEVGPRAEALLYAADRAHHVDTLVRPHLARGGVVLSDRYLDSSIAYPGAGRAREPDQIAALNLWASDGMLPHRTLLLDADPAEIASRRDPDTRDRLERAPAAFHEAVRDAYLSLAESEPERFVVIDATGTADEVHAAVLAAVEEDLARLDPTVEPAAATRPPREER
jgi:dTMP kinase